MTLQKINIRPSVLKDKMISICRFYLDTNKMNYIQDLTNIAKGGFVYFDRTILYEFILDGHSE